MSATNANGDSFYEDINLACERFEAEWQSGGEPRIELFVAEVPEAARPELTRELLNLEIYYRRKRGDKILPRDYDSYPEYAMLIDELLGPSMAREPEPDADAMLMDELDAPLRGLPKLFREVLERRQLDQPVVEIAEQLGVSRRAVYRILDVLKERLKRSTDAGKC
jgi:DNA-directed RNA polymerase specialized sigma24 family protein